MRQYAVTNMKPFTKASPHGWDIIEVPSSSNPNKKYRVDVTHGRCSCPAWIFQRGGERKPCKHLIKWGFVQLLATGSGNNIGEVQKAPSQSVKEKV